MIEKLKFNLQQNLYHYETIICNYYVVHHKKWRYSKDDDATCLIFFVYKL